MLSFFSLSAICREKKAKTSYFKFTALEVFECVFQLHYVAADSHYSRSMAPLKTYLAERSTHELITLIGCGKMFDTKLLAII